MSWRDRPGAAPGRTPPKRRHSKSAITFYKHCKQFVNGMVLLQACCVVVVVVVDARFALISLSPSRRLIYFKKFHIRRQIL
jgi:hypothetical protein